MYRPTPNFIVAMLAAAVLYFGCTHFAGAADANLTWVNATQNTDGSDIPATGDNALKDTRIKYGTCNAAKTAVATQEGSLVIVAAPGQARTITGLADKEYCFQARHSNNGGQLSDFSGAVSKDYTPPLRKPRPPGSISVATLYEDMQDAARWQAYVSAPLVLFGA